MNWMKMLGLDDPGSPYYLFWSGIAGQLDKLAIIGWAIHTCRRHTCHRDRCWRIAHFSAGEHRVCAKHRE